MKRIRILLADDHKITTEGLRIILEPEFEIAGIVEDGRSLLDAAEEFSPDIIVADVSMPELNGIEAARRIKLKYPDIKVVFLTMHNDMEYAASAFEAGASAYVLKLSSPSELLYAIHESLRNRTYITPVISEKLWKTYTYGANRSTNAAGKITARQREVLQLLAEGKSAKNVAAVLGISVRTVEFHKYRMMETLGIMSSAELVQFAIRHGII